MFTLVRPARTRRIPSQRNLQIYEAVKFDGQTQAAVAQQYGVAQSRVSQIVASVEAWAASRIAVESLTENAGISTKEAARV